MANPLPHPTESELEVLQVLWQLGPSTVRTVNEQLNKQREVGYTTTLKIMQIMLEKGLLSCDKAARSHIYSPLVKEESVQQKMLDRFLNTTFRGSASKLVMQALGGHKASKEELEAIRKLIDKMEGGES